MAMPRNVLIGICIGSVVAIIVLLLILCFITKGPLVRWLRKLQRLCNCPRSDSEETGLLSVSVAAHVLPDDGEAADYGSSDSRQFFLAPGVVCDAQTRHSSAAEDKKDKEEDEEEDRDEPPTSSAASIQPTPTAIGVPPGDGMWGPVPVVVSAGSDGSAGSAATREKGGEEEEEGEERGAEGEAGSEGTLKEEEREVEEEKVDGATWVIWSPSEDTVVVGFPGESSEEVEAGITRGEEDDASSLLGSSVPSSGRYGRVPGRQPRPSHLHPSPHSLPLSLYVTTEAPVFGSEGAVIGIQHLPEESPDGHLCPGEGDSPSSQSPCSGSSSKRTSPESFKSAATSASSFRTASVGSISPSKDDTLVEPPFCAATVDDA